MSCSNTILQPLIDLMSSDPLTILFVLGVGVAGACIQHYLIIHWNWPGKKRFWRWYSFWLGLSKEELFPNEKKPTTSQNTLQGREEILRPEQVQGFSAQAIHRKLKAQKRQAREFVPLMVPVLVAFAQADSPFSREKIIVMLRFFQHTLGWQGAELNQAKKLIKAAMHQPRPLADLLADCDRALNYDFRLRLVDLVYQLVWTKEQPIPAELKLARHIGQRLGVLTADQRGIEAKYRFRETRAAGHT